MFQQSQLRAQHRKKITALPHTIIISAEPAASTASKKDYRSTAYNNYCIKSAAPRHCSSELDDAQVLHDFSADLVDLDNEVYTFEVEASSESEASEQAERIAFDMGIQVSFINIYKQ